MSMKDVKLIGIVWDTGRGQELPRSMVVEVEGESVDELVNNAKAKASAHTGRRIKSIEKVIL